MENNATEGNFPRKNLICFKKIDYVFQIFSQKNSYDLAVDSVRLMVVNSSFFFKLKQDLFQRFGHKISTLMTDCKNIFLFQHFTGSKKRKMKIENKICGQIGSRGSHAEFFSSSHLARNVKVGTKDEAQP